MIMSISKEWQLQPRIKATTSGRLIIVSNRLPINILYEGTSYRLERSIGGVATGLESLRGNAEMVVWIGWLGDVKDDDQPALERDLAILRMLSCVPAWTSCREIL